MHAYKVGYVCHICGGWLICEWGCTPGLGTPVTMSFAARLTPFPIALPASATASPAPSAAGNQPGMIGLYAAS